MHSYQNKVFVIGFQKTGTTSLGQALEILGYRVCGTVGANDPHIAETVFDRIKPLLDQYSAFQDNPWCVLYEDLDKQFPNSKFILTIRQSEKWILSVLNHFGSTYRPLNKWIYGVDFPLGNEQVFINRYERHNREVLSYFKDRPDDLLVISSNQDYSWTRVCDFLGKPKPSVPFPYLNKSQLPFKNRSVIRAKNFLFRK